MRWLRSSESIMETILLMPCAVLLLWTVRHVSQLTFAPYQAHKHVQQQQQHISLVISSQEVIWRIKRITAAKCIICPPEESVASQTRRDVNTVKLYLFSAWSSALCFGCQNERVKIRVSTSKRTSPFHCQTVQRLPCQDAEHLRKQISTGEQQNI